MPVSKKEKELDQEMKNLVTNLPSDLLEVKKSTQGKRMSIMHVKEVSLLGMGSSFLNADNIKKKNMIKSGSQNRLLTVAIPV